MKPISIVVLPEDSADHASETLQEVVKKMLYLIDPAIPLYDRKRIRLEPSSPEARRAFRGSDWQSPRQRQKRVDLIQYIKSHLMRHDVDGFVIIHVDGDLPYGQSSDGELSLNQKRVNDLLISPLRVALTKFPELIHRLVLIVPYYSIEAWLYLSTAAALRLYERHYQTHTHDIEEFMKWHQSPEQLDEVLRPKELVAIGARFNQELARDFPAQRVYEVRKSFHKSVERLRTCAPLSAALQEARGE